MTATSVLGIYNYLKQPIIATSFAKVVFALMRIFRNNKSRCRTITLDRVYIHDKKMKKKINKILLISRSILLKVRHHQKFLHVFGK